MCVRLCVCVCPSISPGVLIRSLLGPCPRLCLAGREVRGEGWGGGRGGGGEQEGVMTVEQVW